MSVKVVLAPMVMVVSVMWMKRSSVRWLMEIRDFWWRRPAASATMISVPPAMGVWRPGLAASWASTAARVGGAVRAYWVGSECIGSSSE